MSEEFHFDEAVTAIAQTIRGLCDDKNRKPEDVLADIRREADRLDEAVQMEKEDFIQWLDSMCEGEEAAAMTAEDAMAMAEDMDLPDGAHFAMIGELMGADGDEAYMTGIEATRAHRKED